MNDIEENESEVFKKYLLTTVITKLLSKIIRSHKKIKLLQENKYMLFICHFRCL